MLLGELSGAFPWNHATSVLVTHPLVRITLIRLLSGCFLVESNPLSEGILWGVDPGWAVLEEGAHREAEKNGGERGQGGTGTGEASRPITEPQTEELRLQDSLSGVGTVFTRQGNRNKVPHTVWLNNRRYCLPVPGSKSPRSRGQQARFLLRRWVGSARAGGPRSHWHVEKSPCVRLHSQLAFSLHACPCPNSPSRPPSPPFIRIRAHLVLYNLI